MKKNQIQELYEQYAGGLEEWQIKLAISRMRRFRVPIRNWPDTMQELAIEIHKFKFDQARAHAAKEKTILCRILDNRIKTLARNNGRYVAMLKRLSEMTIDTECSLLPEENLVSVDLRKDVRKLLVSLSPEMREICLGLMKGESKYEIGRRTGRHYMIVCRKVDKIREIMIDRGMN